MRYYKTISNGYILYIGTGTGGTGIEKDEYNEINEAIASKPPATDTTDYRLRVDLTWEPYEIDPPDPDPDLDDSEALEILLGGAVE